MIGIEIEVELYGIKLKISQYFSCKLFSYVMS